MRRDPQPRSASHGPGLAVVAALAAFLVAGAAPSSAEPLIELLFQNTGDSYAENIRSVTWTSPVLDEEAADDFDVRGTVERVIFYGRNDCTLDCPEPALTGAWIRFFEATASGPGALQREEYHPASDPLLRHDAAGGARMIDVTLREPFRATGEHFVSVQLEYEEPFNWRWFGSNSRAPVGSFAYWRDALAGTAWEQARDYWGEPVAQDLAFALWGVPEGAVEPPPVAGCGEWREIPSPNPTNADRSILEDVHAFAPDDAWAVGVSDRPIEGDPTGRDTSLAMHWDGTAWTIFPTPNPSPAPSITQVHLHGVSGAAPDDAWAVGFARGYGTGGLHVGLHALALHWDGTEWSDAEMPIPSDISASEGASGDMMYDVVAIAPSDVWMGGRWWVVSDPSTHAITWPGAAVHWDGSGFDVHPMPMVSPEHRQHVNALAAVDSHDVWAVGDGDDTGGVSYAWHWDGSGWSHVPGPTRGVHTELQAVVALSSDDVWAGGRWRDDLWRWHPFMMHWDGSTWTEHDAPAGGASFAAWGSDDVMSVGEGGFARWNGTEWTSERGPTLIPQGRVLALETVGPCDLWAVGEEASPGARETLTARLSGGGGLGPCGTVPPEVVPLIVTDSGDGTASLSWPPAVEPDVTHDVARGLVSDLGVADPECVARDLVETSHADSDRPGVGLAHYYLVRATNPCGPGPWSTRGLEGCP